MPSKERRSCFIAYQFRLGLFKQGLSVLYILHSYISLETRKSGFVLARVFKYNEPCFGSHVSHIVYIYESIVG